jgi:hypothetical protein
MQVESFYGLDERKPGLPNSALFVPSKPELLGFYRKVDEIR